MKLQPPPGPQVHPESCTGTHPEMYWEGEIQFTPAPFFGLLRPPFSVYSGPFFGLLRPPFRFTPAPFSIYSGHLFVTIPSKNTP